MKKFSAYSVLMVLTLSAHFSFAGTEGHGGGGIMCTDPETGKVTVELLDFWAGRIRKLNIPTTNDVSVNDQLEAAIQKSYPDKRSRKEPRDDINSIMKRAKPVETDHFPIPHDTGSISLTPNCKLVGIVNYEEHPNNPFRREKITVNSRVYALLSNSDKAGLWFHEAAFFFLRNYTYDGRDSTMAQWFTSIAFSTDGFDTAKWPKPKSH